MEMKIVLKTKAVGCASCERLIADLLAELRGIRSVHVDSASGDAEIVYDDSSVHPNAIRAVIRELGLSG